MSSFNARLRMGRTRLPLGVEVDIFQERMTLTAGDRTVADWPLDGLDVIARLDGFHIKVDDEEIVLNVTDSTKFAAELGVAKRQPARLADVAADRPSPPGMSSMESHLDRFRRANGEIPPGPTSETTLDEQPEEVQRRISDIARALTSGSVSPADAFARWLSLLKEINRRHEQGSMPTDLYHQLNTQLLDLIPDPI